MNPSVHFSSASDNWATPQDFFDACNAEALVAVWDGRSNGTRHMIDTAKEAGLKVYIHWI